MVRVNLSGKFKSRKELCGAVLLYMLQDLQATWKIADRASYILEDRHQASYNLVWGCRNHSRVPQQEGGANNPGGCFV
jgi:hypothetical protein